MTGLSIRLIDKGADSRNDQGMSSLLRPCWAYIYLCTAFLNQAQAFELWPELQFLVPREQKTIEDPRLYDGEYYSDLRTFSHRPKAELAWLQHNKAYQGSVGSLNSTRFQVEERLKFRHNVSDSTRLGLLYIKQQDLYYVTENTLLEISHHWNSYWRNSLIGNIKSDKNELDIGWRTEYLGSSNQTHALSLFAPEFSHNERNESDDKFDTSPLSLTYQWLQLPKTDEYRHFFIRYERPVKWIFPTVNEFYEYERWAAGYRSLRSIPINANLSYRLEYNDKTESLSSLPLKDTLKLWRSQRYSTEIAIHRSHHYFWPERWGARVIHVRWSDQQNKSLDQTTLMPFFEYTFTSGPAFRKDDWSVEYEQSFHWNKDPKNIVFANSENLSTFDHRLNLTYNFRWNSHARLSFLFTADLDRFGSGETWEGGGGRLEMLY